MKKLLLLIVLIPMPLAAMQAMAEVPRQALQFNRDVLPILAENCFACHGFDQQARQADLRLDVRAGAIGSRDGETAVVPGNPESSAVIERINSADPELLMPPPASGKQLTAGQRDTLRRWIASGAEYQRHWAFVPPVQAEPPPNPQVADPIDRFIQARLATANLEPASIATSAALIRRVSLDLIGLPPTPQQIDAFESAAKQDPQAAWRELVDRLLESPHYGERWGRWWLDQARYADSNGYSVDAPRSIWKYRDWVVDALNDDMPFDQFTIEQLAGDLLPDASVSQQVATGFHRNTQINQEGGIDKEQFRVDSVFDRVATTGSVWLGLSIGCAQCHDHKFDPIRQREFYRLFAFFNNQDEPTIKVFPPGVDEAALTAERESAETKLKALVLQRDSELAAWESSRTDADRQQLSKVVLQALAVPREKRTLNDQLTLLAGAESADAELRSLIESYQDLGKQLRDAPTTLVFSERPVPRPTALLVQGDFTRRAEAVTPGTPSVLHPLRQLERPPLGHPQEQPLADSPPKATGQPTRLDLARWIVSPENPLTARVIVNRVWQHYFGRGLVSTDSDFGRLGARPSHPALLDWLASEFVRRGMSLKAMHRLIVTTHVYRQSSVADGRSREIDPANRWLSRQTRLRLDAEIVRDVALVASRLLVAKLGGPPVYPPIPAGVMSQGQVAREWPESTGENRYRRGLYTFFYRATPPPSLSVFDAPDGYSVCTRRNRSNTPLQSLTLMNDTACFEFAEALEQIIEQEGAEMAFRRCTSRRPSTAELAVLDRLDPLTAARVLLNLDETITRE